MSMRRINPFQRKEPDNVAGDRWQKVVEVTLIWASARLCCPSTRTSFSQRKELLEIYGLAD